MGGNVVGVGPTMCLANHAPVCGTSLPPLPQDLAPSESQQDAEGHDEGMWKAAEWVMGTWPGTAEQQAVARQIATLPMKLGGLGLRSARWMAPAAFWASWADAMPMLSTRLPTLTDQIIEHLENGGVGCHCLQELTESTLRLDRSGFLNRPEWLPLRDGVRPPTPSSAEPGEWQHGWQFHASSSLEYHHRETVIIAQSCAAD